jgi:hypothetical protein
MAFTLHAQGSVKRTMREWSLSDPGRIYSLTEFSIEACLFQFIYLFINDSVTMSDYMMSNGWVINEKLIGKDVEGSSRGLEVLYTHLFEVTEGNHETPLVSVVGVPAPYKYKSELLGILQLKMMCRLRGPFQQSRMSLTDLTCSTFMFTG